MILGGDALIQGDGVMDYTKGTLQWYGQALTLSRYTDYASIIGSVQGCESTGYKDIDSVLAQYKNLFSSEKASLGYCDLIPFTMDTGDSKPISALIGLHCQKEQS